MTTDVLTSGAATEYTRESGLGGLNRVQQTSESILRLDGALPGFGCVDVITRRHLLLEPPFNTRHRMPVKLAPYGVGLGRKP